MRQRISLPGGFDVRQQACQAGWNQRMPRSPSGGLNGLILTGGALRLLSDVCRPSGSRLGWLVGLVVVSRPWPCPKGRRDAGPRASGWRRRTIGNVDVPVVAAEKFLDLAAALNAYDRLTRGTSSGCGFQRRDRRRDPSSNLWELLTY